MFNSWTHACDSLLHARRLLHRAVTRLLSHNTARAWQAWHSFTSERSTTLNRLRWGLRIFVNHRLALGFHSWQYACGVQQQVHAQHRVLFRALCAFMHRSKHIAFSSWRQAHCELNQHHMVMRMAISEWMGGRRKAAWATWREQVAVRRMLSAFVHQPLARCWRTWVDHADSKALRRTLQASEKKRLARALTVLGNQSLARSFSSWSARAASEAHARQRLRGAAHEWLGSRRRAAWSTWLETADERRMLRRAAMYFRSPAARRALGSWRQYTEQSMSSRSLLSGALNSLRMLSARRAYNTWAASARLLALAQAFCST